VSTERQRDLENHPLPDPLPADPLALAAAWLDEARGAVPENPTAMTLATVDERGAPDARMVLCRGFDREQGFLAFYTDRESGKGRQLEASPRAALVFYWEPLRRQLRVRGPVVRAPEADSDAYFASRPGGAQVSAVTSRQSQPIDSRKALVDAHTATARRLGVAIETEQPAGVARPERWGGYRVWIESIEFWIGQLSRLHDRVRYTRELDPAALERAPRTWRAVRLQP
jgi:pyridoxamine 5'-phosphate oxidase